MHEYSIVQALLDRVEREAVERSATAIHRLHLRIGELSGVEVDLLTTAFDTFKSRSVSQHAELVVHPVAAVWTCPGCGLELTRGQVLRCPECALPARLSQGGEIFLDRIEMEVA